MVITFILSLISVFGTLAIVAYLRQMEDGMAEVQQELSTPLCPICELPHPSSAHKKPYRGLKRVNSYYRRKRKAINNYYSVKKKHQRIS